MTIHINGTVRHREFTLTLDETFPSGTTWAILGANGAGKSTLLRAIAGLQPLTTGSLSIDGALVDHADGFITAQRRRVGLVFQDYALFPHLSVADNVSFGFQTPRGGNLRKGRARREAAHLLEQFALAELAERKPGQLSGGQSQRVALARALAPRPQVLLLDEPLAALDVVARAQVREDLALRLAEFTGITMIVTHDPADARLATHVAILDQGLVTQSGTVWQVCQQPIGPYARALADAFG